MLWWQDFPKRGGAEAPDFASLFPGAGPLQAPKARPSAARASRSSPSPPPPAAPPPPVGADTFASDLSYMIALLVKGHPEAAPWCLVPALYDCAAARVALVSSVPGVWLAPDRALLTAAAALEGACTTALLPPQQQQQQQQQSQPCQQEGRTGSPSGPAAAVAEAACDSAAADDWRGEMLSWQPAEGEACGPLLGLEEVYCFPRYVLSFFRDKYFVSVCSPSRVRVSAHVIPDRMTA